MDKDTEKKVNTESPEDVEELSEEIDETPEKIENEDVVTEVDSHDRDITHNRKKGFLKYIIAAVVIIAAVKIITGFFGTDSLEGKVESVSRMEFDTSSQYDFCVFGDNTVIANKNGVYAYDFSGDVKWDYESTLSSPKVEADEKVLLVNDTAKNLALVFDKKGNVKSEVKFKNDCVTASVNENGWITAILHLKGYKARVVVYDNKGKLHYQWDSATNNVISAELSDDNKILAVSLLDTQNFEKASGIINLFDITTTDKPFFTKSTNSNIVSYLRWSEKNLILVGSSEIFKMSSTGKVLWSYKYEGTMVRFNISDNSVFALAIEDNSTSSAKHTKVYTINDDGKELGVAKIKGEINNIEVKDGIVSAIETNEITVLKKNAEIKKTAKLPKNVIQGLMINKGTKFFVISGNDAENIKIK